MDTKLVFKHCLLAYNKKDSDYEKKTSLLFDKYLDINKNQNENFEELKRAEKVVQEVKKKIKVRQKQCQHIYNDYSNTCIVCDYRYDPDDERCEYNG